MSEECDLLPPCQDHLRLLPAAHRVSARFIARSLHRQGWHVAIADRDQDAGLASPMNSRSRPRRCTFIRVDISVENEVRRLSISWPPWGICAFW